MKTTWIGGLAVVLCGAMVAPRAEAQNREHQQLAAEVRMLQEQTQQLALTLAALNETLKTINTRLACAITAAKSNVAAVPFCTAYLGNLVIPGITIPSKAAFVHL